MATLFAVNYDGLRPKGSYEEIIDKLSAGRPELRQPDRRAKFLRESPQVANLLDGEGSLSFVEMGRQQLAAAAHQSVEQRVREAASEPGAAPAQALRAAFTQTASTRTSSVRTQAGVDSADRFSQTRNPTLTETGSQAFGAQTRSGGTQTEQSGSAEFFDIGHDDRMEEDLQDLNVALETQDAADDQQRQKVQRLVARNLGEDVEAQRPFAARMAAVSVASSSSPSAAAAMTPDQVAYAQQMFARSAAQGSGEQSSPGGTLEGGTGSTQTLAEAAAPKAKAMAMAVPKATKRGSAANGGNGSRPKSKAKSGPRPAIDLSDADEDPRPRSKAKAGPRPTVALTDSGGSADPQVSTGQSATSSSAPAGGTGEATGLESMELDRSKTWWNGLKWKALRRQAEAFQGRPFTTEELYGDRGSEGKPIMTKLDFKKIIGPKVGIRFDR